MKFFRCLANAVVCFHRGRAKRVQGASDNKIFPEFSRKGPDRHVGQVAESGGSFGKRVVQKVKT